VVALVVAVLLVVLIAAALVMNGVGGLR